MPSKILKSLCLSLSAALLATACTSYTQTTSGAAYLDRYAGQTATAGAPAMSSDIRAAADVEPTLRFPARIGIARIDNGRMTPVPQAEAEAWLAMAGRLGPDWGQFVPISPLVVALAAPQRAEPNTGYGWDWQSREMKCTDWQYCMGQTINEIRTGAARQHVDAVLIYETSSTGESKSNPLAVTKLALVGFFLAPSENAEAEGFAQALLLDVRNGYTYGFASAVTEDAAFTLSTSVNSDEALASVLDEAKTAAAIELTAEVEQMARDLRLELAEKRSGPGQAAAQ